MATLTVTAKGQITLKQELLRHLNVTPGQKVASQEAAGRSARGGPAPKTGSIEDFIGSFKKGRPQVTIEQIKKFTEDAWAGKR